MQPSAQYICKSNSLMEMNLVSLIREEKQQYRNTIAIFTSIKDSDSSSSDDDKKKKDKKKKKKKDKKKVIQHVISKNTKQT